MLVRERINYYEIQLSKTEKDFRAKRDFVKLIPGHKWNSDSKTWFIPRNGFDSDQAVIDRIYSQLQSREVVRQIKRTPVQPLPDLPANVAEHLARYLKKEMYPFQLKGVAYNLIHDRVLIADQQGLGKSIQAIASAVVKNEWPGLVICKNSLRLNWRNEWDAWTDKRTMVFSDSIQHTWYHLFQTGFYDVGIVNYDSLHKYFVKAVKIPKGEKFRLHHIDFFSWISLFKWVIVDESHFVKDLDARRTKFTAGITQGLPQVYLLSGTPALNHPMEVYTQICILNQQKNFGSLEQFKNTYCGKKNRANLPALNKLLTDHCYYRRIKSEVAPELPDKTRQIILCDIDNRVEYDKCRISFKKFLKSNGFTPAQINRKMRAEALTQLMELKKLAAIGKLPAVKEWIESMMDSDEKFVLFAYHRDIQLRLQKMAPGIIHFGGGRKPEEIDALTKQFWKDEKTHGIIASISADSEGHNWQCASNGGHVELPWHFGKCEQGEDRIHRIGTKDAVTWNYFLADNTVDRMIYDLIMEKKDMHDQLTGTNEDIETRTIDRILNLFSI